MYIHLYTYVTLSSQSQDKIYPISPQISLVLFFMDYTPHEICLNIFSVEVLAFEPRAVCMLGR